MEESNPNERGYVPEEASEPQRPRVVAVIVHHRGIELISECVASLAASRGVDIDLVIVLNGCEEALPESVLSNSRVHVVELKKPVGFAEANNIGIRWARKQLSEFSFAYFVNNDTVTRSDSLAQMVDQLVQDQTIGIIGPRIDIYWAKNHINSLGINVTRDAWGWDEGIGRHSTEVSVEDGIREVLAVTGSALLIRSDLSRRIGDWTELYHYYFEDIDLCLKAWEHGFRVVVDPAARVLHHISATGGVDSEWKRGLFLRNRILLSALHWPVRLFLREVMARVLIDEVLGQPKAETRLHRRALRSAAWKLPWVFAKRILRRRGDSRWVEMLRPAGSVPVIHLPEMYGNDVEEPQADTRHSPEAASIRPEIREALERWADAPGCRRVLVVGRSPLPWERAEMNYAPGARSWQFARGLESSGARVVLACSRMPGGYTIDESRDSNLTVRNGVLIVWLPHDQEDPTTERVARIAKSFQPDCLVGATAQMSKAAISAADHRPVWADVFGDLMAEGQAKCYRAKDDSGLAAYRHLLTWIAERADGFSTVSGRQRYALLGVHGVVGRLSGLTAGREFVHSIPCAVFDDEDGWYERVDDVAEEWSDFISGRFVVLWGGGFNTWCDFEVFYTAMEQVFDAEKSVVAVVTGARIPGQDDVSYSDFEALVRASSNRDRWKLMGCLPTDQARWWVQNASLGVLSERRLLERELGSSGRMCDWISNDLPVVMTAQSEAGALLCAEDLAVEYDPGVPESLAEALLECIRNRDLTDMALRAREYAYREWSVETTVRPLSDWVNRSTRWTRPPSVRGFAISTLSNDLPRLERRVQELEQNLIGEQVARTELEQALGQIHNSALWRLGIVWRALPFVGSRRRPAEPQPETAGSGDD